MEEKSLEPNFLTETVCNKKAIYDNQKYTFVL